MILSVKCLASRPTRDVKSFLSGELPPKETFDHLKQLCWITLHRCNGVGGKQFVWQLPCHGVRSNWAVACLIHHKFSTSIALVNILPVSLPKALGKTRGHTWFCLNIIPTILTRKSPSATIKPLGFTGLLRQAILIGPSPLQ